MPTLEDRLVIANKHAALAAMESDGAMGNIEHLGKAKRYSQDFQAHVWASATDEDLIEYQSIIQLRSPDLEAESLRHDLEQSRSRAKEYVTNNNCVAYDQQYWSERLAAKEQEWGDSKQYQLKKPFDEHDPSTWPDFGDTEGRKRVAREYLISKGIEPDDKDDDDEPSRPPTLWEKVKDTFGWQ